MPVLVTAIIKPFKLEEVREALLGAGIAGLTVSEVQGYGRQAGRTETFRGAEYTVEYVPKIRLDLIVDDGDADRAVEVVTEAAKTGKIGDGKVWSMPLERVVRVRTGEQGVDAI
ncbi:MAG: P-II family nitrogen regulator [Acidimicrobiales bacterium]|nr:P-II family nitrogen regulator [Acidimicrobiales bacterium]